MILLCGPCGLAMRCSEPGLALSLQSARLACRVAEVGALGRFHEHEKVYRHFKQSSRLALPARELSQVTAYFSE